MLDLNVDTSNSGKLAKQITQLRKARGAQQKKAVSHYKVVSAKTVIGDKERNVLPLNLNIDLRRLTQLFGRSLYIKYFIKNADLNLDRRRSKESPIHRGDDEGYGGDHGFDEAEGDQQQVVGFEDAHLVDGFAANLASHLNEHNMVTQRKIDLFKKFEQPMNKADEIKLDLLKIQKKIDVKRLKHQLWTVINPNIDQVENQVDHRELKMSDVLGSLYYNQEIDSENVSVHSAFICLLHIANEKGKNYWYFQFFIRTLVNY